MAESSSEPPPVPPDLLFLFGSLDLIPQNCSPALQNSNSPTIQTNPVQVSSNPVSPQPCDTSAPWNSLFKPASHNLYKMASPSFDEDGTPTVEAPESITFGTSRMWKNYLIAYFHGTPPSPPKIFSYLNPIWGGKGRITVKKHSDRICLILIPCEETRKWALDIGFWHSGNCSFTLAPWTASSVLKPIKLVHAPTWVLFKNIPPELWSIVGFSTIASGVGFPVQSEFPKLTPYSNGITKLKVVIDLYKQHPPLVRVKDRLGNSALIEAFYPKLPPKCNLCNEFGHLKFRCPESKAKRSSVDSFGLRPNLPERQPLASPPVPSPIHVPESNSRLDPQRKSSSLPSSPVHSKRASNSPCSDHVFVEEEEMIKAGKAVLRARLPHPEPDDPPIQEVVSKKTARKLKRQALLSHSEACSQESSKAQEHLSHPQLVFGSLKQVLQGPVSPPSE
ncbi:unnamed protein product [Microthlaspi erraticum]|uniref:DUF4283 domain-containing protein n=1 Tax=Microthlaspi erraticum TaxID=1685480 RepID=A0A6D2HK66_9BRAS|nr:unnamed protein product [Microthlaspi erraticum]